MEYKIYDKLTDDEKAIRIKVFVEEQGFNEEFDSIDNYSKHLVIYDNNKPVAVGRYFTDDNEEYHIGRIAVLKEYRQFGYGKKVMQIIENEIKKTNAKRIVLSAQVRAKGFYQKCGYSQTGSIYLDEYCEHIKMYKDIQK
jgi:predicted GNAT family N-acyltransferase